MTSIGVTNRAGAYNQATEAHDWKRRSEGWSGPAVGRNDRATRVVRLQPAR
jgi:hypothetical protein